MSIRYIRKVELSDPVMVACWPGIGNIGLIAVDMLRRSLRAEELAYIEPWDFYYPNRVIIRNGELKEMGFPGSEFFFAHTPTCDIIFFTGDEQPAEGGKVYAEGGKAYAMANMVLDVAEKYRCADASIPRERLWRLYIIPAVQGYGPSPTWLDCWAR